jgi:hypothetical protein
MSRIVSMLLGFPSSLVSFVSDLLWATNSHQLVPGLLGATRMLRLLLWIPLGAIRSGYQPIQVITLSEAYCSTGGCTCGPTGSSSEGYLFLVRTTFECPSVFCPRWESGLSSSHSTIPVEPSNKV